MAFQQGAATGIADLLDKAVLFLPGAGWTVNRRDATSLSISKGAVYQNYFDNSTEIHMNAATGYDSGSAWNAQPGANPNTQKSRQMGGAFAQYYFFAGADYFHIVVEVDPGLYRHLPCGEIEKSSAYTGGQYSGCVNFSSTSVWLSSCFGSDLDSSANVNNYTEASSFRINIDAQDGWKHFVRNHPTLRDAISTDHMNSLAQARFQVFYDWFNRCTPNTINGLSVLSPIYFFIERADGYMSPCGYVKDMRTLNIINYDPGQSQLIGTAEWLIFPASVKGVGVDYASGNFGYAYKKVT